MSDWQCLRFFHDAFENGIESLDARDKGVAKRSLLILGALHRICNGRTRNKSYCNRNTMSRGYSENSCTLGLAATIHATVPLVSLGAWKWGVNRTGLETEVIVKEKCKELIQCQKT